MDSFLLSSTLGLALDSLSVNYLEVKIDLRCLRLSQCFGIAGFDASEKQTVYKYDAIN